MFNYLFLKNELELKVRAISRELLMNGGYRSTPNMSNQTAGFAATTQESRNKWGKKNPQLNVNPVQMSTFFGKQVE